VHGCVGTDAHRDPLRVARVIAELGCDTIGLQEAFGVAEIAEALGMEMIAGPDHRWHNRHVGNALLTRRRVLAVRHHEFGLPNCEPRTAIDVDLEVGGKALRDRHAPRRAARRAPLPGEEAAAAHQADAP